MLRDVLISAAAALAIAGCAVPTYDYAREPDPRKSEYQVGPLDQLSIMVWNNKELSAEVTVRPDGIITLPLIGDVKAAGRTTTELQKELVTRYAAFIHSEEVTVAVGVHSVNSYQFTVSGNVERAGVYNSKSYVTAIDAVAMAGGPNRFAGSTIYVVRGSPARRIPIDLQRATSGEHPEENIVLLRGDLVVVR